MVNTAFTIDTWIANMDQTSCLLRFDDICIQIRLRICTTVTSKRKLVDTAFTQYIHRQVIPWLI